MADTVVTLTLVERGQDPATVANRLLSDDPAAGTAAVAAELQAISLGARGGKVIALVESATAAAATGTVVVDSGNTTAGDALHVTIPGLATVVLTSVALDATVTASPHTGLWSLETVTDTAQGASLASAINEHTLLRRYISASNSSGTVTITALNQMVGATGNSISLVKVVTTAGALTITAMSGGAWPGDAPSETCTLGGAALTADDTLTIGSVVLTWKASAANENQVTIGVSDAASLANLTAKINAHSKLQGLVSASDDGATVCTLTWLGPPRAGELLYFAKNSSNASAMVITGSGTFTNATTDAYQAARKVWTWGAV